MILTLTEAEWTARRRKPGAFHIGASEAAACLGYGGYADATPLDVWRRHHDPSWQPPVSDRMDLGTALEPAMLGWYHRATGRTLRVPRWTIAVHERYPWLSATPDAWVVDPTDSSDPDCDGLVEVKIHATRDGWGRDDTIPDLDGSAAWPSMPVHHWVQVQVQIACSGRSWCDVVALLAGVPRVVRVMPSPGRTAVMLRDLDAWRTRHLVGGERPAGSTPAEVIADHARQHPGHHGSVRATGAAAITLHAALAADEAVRRAEAERDRCLAELAGQMGGASCIWSEAGEARRTARGLTLRPRTGARCR